jgi:small subunit ribosomal protein S8
LVGPVEGNRQRQRETKGRFEDKVRMGMTDPIADMLTRLRNANMVRHKTVELPSSKLKVEIAKILSQEGYISGYATTEGTKPTLQMQLKYSSGGERVIHGIRRVSKPGCRIYASVDQIQKVLGGLGVSILSTSRGLLTGEQAKQARVGGEVLCEIW